jgi:hypothetical protein
MKLIHYTNKEFALEPLQYNQAEEEWKNKPRGLWVSVEGEYDWEWWCREEGFHLEHLVVSYEVKLKNDAKILHLKTEEEILNMCILYPFIKPQWDNPEGWRFCGGYEINWQKVSEKYQGIIISPYQWECRMKEKSAWYYGWDCASGCIWDLTCIEEFKLQELPLEK